jgi:hypothetical protein
MMPRLAAPAMQTRILDPHPWRPRLSRDERVFFRILAAAGITGIRRGRSDFGSLSLTLDGDN